MTAPEPAYLKPGVRLAGRYTIGRELGRGGFSVVYLSEDSVLGVQVALKLLVPPPAAAALARERMRREVQAVRGLTHANIVAVHDFVDDGPWSFVVMEYVAGPDLSAKVRQSGALGAIGGRAAGARYRRGPRHGPSARRDPSRRQAAEHPASVRTAGPASPISARPGSMASPA